MKLAYDIYESDKVDAALNPIILLHSIFESKKTWRPLGLPLSQRTRRKVYAVDFRNHGDSSWTDEYTIDLLAEDVNELINDLGSHKVILIGHSIGGKVAIFLTLWKPERIEMLVIEDMTIRNIEYNLGSSEVVMVNVLKEAVEWLKALNNKAEIEKQMRSMFAMLYKYLTLTDEFVNSYDLFNFLPIKWNGEALILDLNLEVVTDVALKNKLYQRKTPYRLQSQFEGDTLFLIGSLSPFKVDKDPGVSEYFPKVKKVILDGAGHFIHHTFPEEFLQEIEIFINSPGPLRSKI